MTHTTSSSSLTRVYYNSHAANSGNQAFLYLADLSSDIQTDRFWDSLQRRWSLRLVELPYSDRVADNNEAQTITSFISSILSDHYQRARLSLDVRSAHSTAITTDIADSTTLTNRDGSIYLNSTTSTALVSADSAVHLFSSPSRFPSDAISHNQIYVPPGATFFASHTFTFTQILHPSQLDHNIFADSVEQIAYYAQLFASLRASNLADSDTNSYSSALAILEDYLPSDTTDQNPTLNTQIAFPNALFSLQLIQKIESPSAELYTSISFDDCDSETDAVTKLLNTSGIPFRISDAPEAYSDNRSYIFAYPSGKVDAHIRKGFGYQKRDLESQSYSSDGSSHPQGQVITLYPTCPETITPFTFIVSGLHGAFLPLMSVIAISLVLSGATLIPAFLIDKLTSLYIPYGNYYSLIFFGISAIAALSVTYVIQLLQARYLVRFEILSDSNMQTMMLDRFLRIDPEYISSFSPGSLQNRIMGISQLRSIITGNLTTILTAYLSVIFNLFYLFTFSFEMSLMVAAAGLILGTATFIAAQQRLEYFKKLTELDGQMLESTNDSINSILQLRASATTDIRLSNFTNVIRPLISSIFAATRLSNRVDTLSSTTTYVLYIFLLPFAYHLAHSADLSRPLTIGSAVAFLTCTQTFLSSFESAIDKTISSYVQGATYWSRAMDILRLPTEPLRVSTTPKSFDGSIAVTNLSFSYTPNHDSNTTNSSPNILKSVNFRIPPGSALIIKGSQRSGKSTLLSVLSAMHLRYSGSIEVSGHDLQSISPRIYRSYISNVPQDLIFKPGSLRGNLTPGVSVSDEKISQELEAFGLSSFIDTLPMKLGTVVTASASAIPTVIKKKLFLLRASLKGSRYIFIDEALDGLPIGEIKQILANYKLKGCTIIATTKEDVLEQSNLFDSIINLDQ